MALSLGTQYLSKFTDIASTTKPPKFPLDLMLCRACGLVQLAQGAPKELLYGEDYGYRSSISHTIRTDLRDIVEQALQLHALQPGDTVVDIGCNDGTLLSFYPDWVTRIGVDPLAKFEQEVTSKGIHFIIDYFNARSFKERFEGKKPAIITAISMFYDLDKPNEFLRDVCEILDESGILVIQQNYLISMVENNAFDNICHEHLEYYSLSTLRFLLSRHGLSVFHVSTNEINGGSIRTFVSREGERPVQPSVKKVAESEPDTRDVSYYRSFQQKIEAIRTVVGNFIRHQVEQGKSFYALGASTRGNTLLQYFGLDSSLIEAAMERNPEKFGKGIASVGIPILSEERARREAPDYFLVLPWHFKEEIVRREAEYVARGGRLLFPLPLPSIVSRDGEDSLM